MRPRAVRHDNVASPRRLRGTTMISAAHETLSHTATRSRHDAETTLSTRDRWHILYEQLAGGHEPCFRSDRRHQCAEQDCRWRADCLAMCAQWRR
jgi:hypothetical protein